MAVSLLEARRRILLNTPHIESASGSIVTFSTDLSANLKECKIHFLPVQEGSGDPSPDNVRPITGWDGVTVYHSGSDRTTPLEIHISFGRTIYGGYADLVNGEVVEEYVAVTLDGVNVKVNYGRYPSDNFYGGGWVYTNTLGISRNSGKTYFCDKLCYGDNSATIPHYQTPYVGNLYYMLRVLPKADYPDGLTTTEVRDLTNEWLQQNPVTVVYPLKASNSYSLTPQTIKALKGINNIWSDANGDVEVKFWKH